MGVRGFGSGTINYDRWVVLFEAIKETLTEGFGLRGLEKRIPREKLCIFPAVVISCVGAKASNDTSSVLEALNRHQNLSVDRVGLG